MRISIADEGTGIAPEDIPKVFDPYYTTKGMGSEKGVGLGLAISYAIVRKHNGSISIESTKGAGLRLPCEPPGVQAGGGTGSGSVPAAGRYSRGASFFLTTRSLSSRSGRNFSNTLATR